MADWRKHPRLEFGIKVVNKETNAVATMSDISVGGCFVKESEGFPPLPIDTRIPLAFEIPGKDEYEDVYIEVEGRVVHHGNEGKGMGINFVMVEPASANVISNFVKAYL